MEDNKTMGIDVGAPPPPDEVKKEILLISKNLQRVLVPTDSINKKRYQCIIVERGTMILASNRIPIFFSNRIKGYAKQLAKENNGKLIRGDKAYDKTVESKLYYPQVYIVQVRVKRKLTKREIAKKAYEKLCAKIEAEKAAKSNPDRVQQQQIPAGAESSTPNELGVPPVQGTEHPSDEEQQGTNVFQLPSNNNITGDKE